MMVQGPWAKDGPTYTPQNSSTESKVMTSFSRSFQLSPYSKSNEMLAPSPLQGKHVNRNSASSMPAPFDSPYLSARWLGEPQSPLALERVLDSEVVLVVEHSHRLSIILGLGASVLAVARGDGDGGKVDLLVHVRCVNRSSSHCACRGCDSVSGGWLDCERVGEGRRKKREKAENLELSDAGVKIAGQRRWDVKRQQAEKLAVAARERESLDCFSFCLRSEIWRKDPVRKC